MKLETQMVVLLLLSVTAVGLYHFVPRTHEIDFSSDEWRLVVGLQTPEKKVSHRLTDRGLEVDFEVAEGVNVPLMGLRILKKDDDQLSDFSWMEHLHLTAFIEGKEQGYFRFHIRNKLPGVTVEEEASTRKFNEISILLNNTSQQLVFDREHFRVPVWWIERHGISIEQATPSFENTEWLQFLAIMDGENSSHKLIIEKMAFKGHWIPTVVLYRTLLLMWLVIAGGVAFQKSLDLRKKGKTTTQLQSINQSLVQQANELSEIAKFDSLTGLLNRFGMRSYVDSAIELTNVHQIPVGVIMIDIDKFKELNDTSGHNFGDEILTKLGELLRAKTNESLSIARWGGEEFLAISCGTDLHQSVQWAEGLRQEIENSLEITCSLGVYQLQAEQPFCEGLDCADKALYQAKSGGRNRVEAATTTAGSERNPNENCQQA